MDQFQVKLKGIKEDVKNFASVVKSFHTQQATRPRHHATQLLRSKVSSTDSITKDSEHILIALSQFEARLEKFDGEIESALMRSTDPLPRIDPPTHDASSVADLPTRNAPSSADSPSAADTSPSAGTPLASDLPGARPLLTDNASPGADHLLGCDTPASNSSPSTDSPSTGNTSSNANSPSTDSAPIGNVSRTPLPSAPRRSGGRLNDENGRVDSPFVRLYNPPDAPPKAPPNIHPDSPPKAMPKPIITLRLSDLGKRLIPKLQTLIEDNSYTGKLLVEDMGLTSTALIDAVQPLHNSEFDAQFEVKHRFDGGIWRLYTRRLNELQLPDLSNIEKPSDDPEHYLRELSLNLPEEPIPYYVGPLSGSVAEKLQSCFPSGDEVCQLGHIPGVSTLYGHVGEEASGTTFHCEDANLRSYNLTLVGWKIWILIRLHHTARFEDLVRRVTVGGSDCDQFVRHTSAIIPPWRLREENIEFDILYSGPGDIVLTQPRQYHAAINRTASFAIATNFVLPNEDPITKTLALCPDDGLYLLEHRINQQHGYAKRKRYTRQPEIPLSMKRPKLHEFLEMPVAEVLARETTNRDAILRFMDVVRAWRKIGGDIRGQLLQVEKCNNRTQALDNLRIAFRENSQLFSFLEILSSVHLVRNLERRLSNVSSLAIDSLLTIRGLTNSHQNRRSIRNELAAYQKWDRLCGATSAYTYEGILCFVPPVFKDYRQVTRTQVAQLSKDHISVFYSKLQEVPYVKRLCEVGSDFQKGVFGSMDFAERPFEVGQENLSKLDLDDLLQLL